MHILLSKYKIPSTCEYYNLGVPNLSRWDQSDRSARSEI